MAYATVDELAEALEIRVTPENTPLLTNCLEAAATEIDHFLLDAYWPWSDLATMPWSRDGRFVVVHDQTGRLWRTPIIVRTNVNRGVEWFKAPATYNGGVGMAQTGAMNAPQSGFERHYAAMLPLKYRWGLA